MKCMSFYNKYSIRKPYNLNSWYLLDTTPNSQFLIFISILTVLVNNLASSDATYNTEKYHIILDGLYLHALLLYYNINLDRFNKNCDKQSKYIHGNHPNVFLLLQQMLYKVPQG